MKAITNLFSRMFKSYNDEMLNIHREWDRQRARSMSPAETAEIDAIFSRHVQRMYRKKILVKTLLFKLTVFNRLKYTVFHIEKSLASTEARVATFWVKSFCKKGFYYVFKRNI